MPLPFAILLQASSHCIPQFTDSKSPSTRESQERLLFFPQQLRYLLFLWRKKIILLEITV